jgi:hypothetical protein
MRTHDLRFAPLPWIAALALLQALGCGSDRPTSAVNVPPSVTITGGPAEGADTPYRTELLWFGSDPDGLVDHYLVAVDAGERIGRGDSPSWMRIDASSAEFLFPATTPEPRTPSDDPISADWHTFHVKAVDDDGAESLPATRRFRALTREPSVTVTGLDDVYAERWELELEGVDPDGRTGRPVGYQWKLVDWVLSPFPPNPGSAIWWVVRSDARNWLIPDDAPAGTDSTDWWPPIDQVDPATAVVLSRPTHVGCCGQIFAVRAVDEAGAVTSMLDMRIGTVDEPGNVFVGDPP